ncbi:MAG TPA: ABC transporter permease [Thermoanaerobaculia bacterium]
MEALWQDFRFGVRTLLRHRLTAGLALLTLALGIGANTAIFSVVNGVLLRPLPYPRPERLIAIIDSAPSLGFPRFSSSGPNFRDWRDENHVFSSLSAYRRSVFNLSGAGTPETVPGGAVTFDFFRTLEVAPTLGRFLRLDDDRPGAERVVVLSDGLWRAHFGADPAVVQRRLMLDGKEYTVIGVAPPQAAAAYDSRVALWVPLALDPAHESRGSRYLKVIGRLRPGIRLPRAQAEMSAIASRLQRQYPEADKGWLVVLRPLRDLMVERVRPALATLQLAVGLIMLIACANVGSLLLARLAAREREIAVRSALGASRGRLTRQVVAESIVLFAAGGAAGLLLAVLAIRALVAFERNAIPRAETIGLDPWVLGYAVLLTLATGAAVGLVPAWGGLGGGQIHRALKESGRAVGGGRAWRLRSALVLAEVALALTLLIGAGLLLRSFSRLRSVDPGFSPDGVLTLTVSLPSARYPAAEPGRQVSFQRRALERLRALPGVTAAATVAPLPFSGADYVDSFRLEGKPRPAPGEMPSADVGGVSPGYFQAMRIPLLRGRTCGEGDDAGAPLVVIVSHALAARFWPGSDPLGQRMSFDEGTSDAQARWWTVVGLVGDVQAEALGGLSKGAMYRCMLQWPRTPLSFVVRSAGAPGALAAPVRQALRELDGELPLDRMSTMPELVAASLVERRIRTLLLALFAALALVLAAVGIYGLISDSVTRRTQEIGIRIALGAGRGQVLGLVLRQGMRLVLAGLAVGLACSWLGARLLADQLYQVGTGDPLTFGAVPVLLAAVALMANWLPARRATEIDPLDALRTE